MPLLRLLLVPHSREVVSVFISTILVLSYPFIHLTNALFDDLLFARMVEARISQGPCVCVLPCSSVVICGTAFVFFRCDGGDDGEEAMTVLTTAARVYLSLYWRLSLSCAIGGT